MGLSRLPLIHLSEMIYVCREIYLLPLGVCEGFLAWVFVFCFFDPLQSVFFFAQFNKVKSVCCPYWLHLLTKSWMTSRYHVTGIKSLMLVDVGDCLLLVLIKYLGV